MSSLLETFQKTFKNLLVRLFIAFQFSNYPNLENEFFQLLNSQIDSFDFIISFFVFGVSRRCISGLLSKRLLGLLIYSSSVEFRGQQRLWILKVNHPHLVYLVSFVSPQSYFRLRSDSDETYCVGYSMVMARCPDPTTD